MRSENNVELLVQEAVFLDKKLIEVKSRLQKVLKSILENLICTGNTVEIPGRGSYTIMCRKGLYYWRPKPVGVYGLGGMFAKKAKKTPVKPKSRE